MEEAANNLEFERAAAIRDRIRGLAHIQGTDVINPASLTDADVIALHQEAGQSCVQVFFIRGGRNNGNRSFFPAHAKGDEPADILAAFIAQFYDDKPTPPLLLLSHAPTEQDLLAEALSLKAERKITLLVPQRGEKHDVVLHAQTNAREALERKLAETAGQGKLLAAVAELFDLPDLPAASKPTTTPTSWAPRPMASWSSPARRGSTNPPTANSRSNPSSPRAMISP